MNDIAMRYLMKKRDSRDMPNERAQMDYGRNPRYYDDSYRRMEQDRYYPGSRDYGREREYSGYFGDVPFGMRTHYPDDYMPRDYGRKDVHPEDLIRLSQHDLEKWGKMLKNADGTMGVHFSKSQIEQGLSQFNVDKRGIDDDVYCMAVNMLYSDYCKVLRKYGADRIEVYLELALAFLNDDDFRGTPIEKLALYYWCIAEE